MSCTNTSPFIALPALEAPPFNKSSSTPFGSNFGKALIMSRLPVSSTFPVTFEVNKYLFLIWHNTWSGFIPLEISIGFVKFTKISILFGFHTYSERKYDNSSFWTSLLRINVKSIRSLATSSSENLSSSRLVELLGISSDGYSRKSGTFIC